MSNADHKMLAKLAKRLIKEVANEFYSVELIDELNFYSYDDLQ